MKYKLVIFDWDGTVMDSIARIVSSLQSAARIHLVPVPSDDKAKSIIGLSLPVVMDKLFPDHKALHQTLMQEYKKQFVNEDSTDTPLFDGVEALFKKLQSNGCQLAIATGKSRQGLDRLLSLTGLTDYFVFTQSADEAQSKPSPQMLSQILAHTELAVAEAVMIGDSTLDLEMAQNIGMDSIGVTFGVGERDELATYEPVAIVDCFSQLDQYLL
ncbi:HAD-IIIA family hydrolase [Pseudoalteromonas sp. C2R02]|uniref:HAD family hydrolase n=1 Tax=Pseudoalteromonas sp. C2R02 TaxID=2841565 RepID=UPI001C0845AC|nr:HAD-IIIA family hydrolase [Pseudoalteromonas sp. C2R02]MBU2969703.1 HAD-IIIA family hydrolase [Pseudoalteromonas sp. C2R02]